MIGFLDESFPQTTANAVRLWSFTKPVMFKNTTKRRENSFGFYALNSSSVIDFKEHSTKKDVCDLLSTIKNSNIGKKIVIVLDNFRSHRAKDTLNFAAAHDIELVYLPAYSPDLNPIEFIWKSIKRVISCNFLKNIVHMQNMIAETFMMYSANSALQKVDRKVLDR